MTEMPNKNAHIAFGVFAGTVYSLIISMEQKPEHRFIEMIGAAIGGLLGCRFPDIAEPAYHPRHRKFAHSIAAGTMSVVSIKGISEAWVAYFRSAADKLAQNRSFDCISESDRNLSIALEILYRLAAGFVPGFIAGYISHLILDAGSPRSLPII